MTKFKIGDKVKAVQASCGWGRVKKGDIGVITRVYTDSSEYKVDFSNEKDWYATDSDLEIYVPKPTNNQRITALENEVKRLDKFSEGLRGELTGALKRIESLEAKLVEKVAIVEKSANQLRAEIIEKAKDFIVKSKFANKFYEVPNGPFGYFHCDVEFIVNEQKRTVVALMRSTNNKSIKAKGIAKCMPDDVFNKYIGMAIALGRALGLDVSEFEQAVQPTKAVNGQLLTFDSGILSTVYEVINVNSNDSLKIIQDDNCKNVGRTAFGDFSENLSPLKIINDTNAIYKEGSN